MRPTFDITDPPRRLRRPGLAILAVIAFAAVLDGTASAVPMRSSSPPCGFVTTGAPWSFKGQKGTAYTVVAEGGCACASGRRYRRGDSNF